MEYNYNIQNHHSNQNSVGEVDIPEPHQPNCHPPEIKKSEEERDTFFISLYPTGEEVVQVQNDLSSPLGPDQTEPDQCGCGCDPEPIE